MTQKGVAAMKIRPALDEVKTIAAEVEFDPACPLFRGCEAPLLVARYHSLTADPAFSLGKRQPHFLFQLPDSIGQAGLRNIELLHCMADGAGAGNSRDIAELLKGHGSFLSACFFYPTAEPPKTQRIFFFEIPNEHCRHIQDTFYPPCNFPYNSTAVLKRLQHSHITKEAFRYGTTAK